MLIPKRGLLALAVVVATLLTTAAGYGDDTVSRQTETVAGLPELNAPGSPRQVDGLAFGYATAWAPNKVPAWVLPADQPIYGSNVVGATGVRIRYKNRRHEVALEDMCHFATEHHFDPNAIIYDQKKVPTRLPSNPVPSLAPMKTVEPQFVWFEETADKAKDWSFERADPKVRCQISSQRQVQGPSK